MGSEGNSSPFVVEKSEVVLVKPAKPTPDVSLSLSVIDNDPQIEGIVQTICVFTPEPQQARHDLASLLQYALSHALVYYYPLAGKLHRKSDDNRLQLNYKAGDGVPFTKATSTSTLSSINYLDSAGDGAYQLVPCYVPVKGCEGYDPLALQVTKFACGGITIGMAHSHSVSDGVGAAQFFRAMIELASGKTQRPSVIPVWDRERLPFNGKLGDVVGSPMAGSFISLTGDMTREILNITSDDITNLKKTIAENEQFTNETEKKVVVTTFEILAAHVWRARCRALNMSPDETAILDIVIDIRSFMDPPLPVGYYGNGCVSGNVVLTAKELREASLAHVVRLIKDMKKAALDKQFVLGKLTEIERRVKDMESFKGISRGFMTLTDWRQIGLQYDGWGGLKNIIPFIPMAMPFISVLLPASKADPAISGGVRLLVALPKDAMTKFKEEMNAI
uniref:3'-N-debenzoyl-2'-deoxytaxol N-benzoyltransferase n=2 Tax=Noccaea caerulescens TaxID=107243 RepID=A0A1J3EFA4_NOCCA